MRRAFALAAVLVGWSFVSPRLPMPWRVPVQAGFGGLLAATTRASVGLRPPRLWWGLRWGLVAGGVAASAVATTVWFPAVRRSMAVRESPDSVLSWLAVRIPLGTVWAEESAFRAALNTAGARAFGASGGRLLQATAFGLSHIADARTAGEPVAPTVVATGVAGWFFGWLADRSGSLAAPMLAHLAINETAAAAALTVRRRSRLTPPGSLRCRLGLLRP
jgi:membrane protease YdiL (CAAX protease family)